MMNVTTTKNMRERLLDKKEDIMRERYEQYFTILRKFENELEEKFISQIEENPFRKKVTAKLELEVPYSSVAEKELIEKFLLILPKKKEKKKQEGIEIKIFIDKEKRNFFIIKFYYSIDVTIDLDENGDLVYPVEQL